MWKRLGKIFKGFMNLFIKNVEASNPEALLEAQREELRENISKFNTNLAKQAAFKARLERMVQEHDRKEKELLAKATANMKAGNREIAAKCAFERKNILTALEGYKTQLATAKKTYEDLVKTRDVTIKEAKAKLEAMTQKLSQVKMKEAESELLEMSKSMVGTIGAGGDTMNRLEESLNERLELASGRADVARDSDDFGEIKMKESEQAALEDAALMELMGQMGMDASPYAAPAATTEKKAMGPSVSAAPTSAELDII